jgi:hypothetical protein
MLSLCYKLHLGLSKRDLNLKFEHKNQGKNPPDLGKAYKDNVSTSQQINKQ